MVDHELQELFLQNSTDKQLRIKFDGGEITNADIPAEEFELTEGICSENVLRFGSCEASQVSFTAYNVFAPLKGKELDISMILAGNTDKPFQIGRYKVQSDKPTADRAHRKVVAYDALYDVLNADVSGWYNRILPNVDSKITLRAFRDSFFSHFGITQEPVELINDGMSVEKTIEPAELSGKAVLNAILELNGAFGRMNRAGKFQYVILQEIILGLYPSDDLYPAEDLYPKDEAGTYSIRTSDYISCEYEDYLVERISKLQIRKEENDIGAISGTGCNCYIVQDNFLCYGKSATDLQVIADNLYSVIAGIWYRPASITAKGNPCLEPGDGIRLWSRNEVVYTYIFSRTLKGIQGLRDSYAAEGERYRMENINSIRQDIKELKGKANVLERSVDETRSTITNVEKGLQSQITQTAESIRSEVTNVAGGLQSQITQNAAGISSKVSKGDVVSEINQSADLISIIGNRFLLNSSNFKVGLDGTIESVNGEFSKATFTDGLFYKLTYNGQEYYYPVIVVNAPGDVVFGVSGMNTHFPGSVTVAGFLSMGGSVVATQSYVNAISDSLQAQIDALKQS